MFLDPMIQDSTVTNVAVSVKSLARVISQPISPDFPIGEQDRAWPAGRCRVCRTIGMRSQYCRLFSAGRATDFGVWTTFFLKVEERESQCHAPATSKYSISTVPTNNRHITTGVLEIAAAQAGFCMEIIADKVRKVQAFVII